MTRGDTPAGEPRRQRAGRGLWVAVGLSLLAHGIVLTALGVVTPKPTFRDSPEPPTLTVQLLPRLARIRTHVPATAAAPTRTAASAAPPPSPLHLHVTPPNPMAPATLAAHANAGSAEGTRIGVGDAPAPLPFEDGHHGVPALLRATVGCNNEEATHLTADEREACNARFAKEARKAAPFSGIDPGKRAYYDAVQQRYQTMHDATAPVPLVARGSLGLFEDESRMIGGQMVGHGAGVGCGMKWGPGANKAKDHRSIADRIKDDAAVMVDVGPLKCGVVIPQGSLTPDIGIKQPH